MTRLVPAFVILLLLVACGPKTLEPDDAFKCSRCDDWNLPLEAFRLYGNTWYVGTEGLTSILIETDDGLLLIDGGLPQSAALIDANIRKLGFDPLNISTILVSHAHFDHVGGVAALQRLSGAKVYSSPAAAVTLSSGTLQADDPQFLNGEENTGFPAIKNVATVGNGDAVTVGNVSVRAIYTPGHTPGGMSWTWPSCALGTCYDIVYADSLTSVSAEGYRYSDGSAANQLAASAAAIADLDCDILLSPHPFFFGLHEKLERREEGNPFVNNVACSIYAQTALQWLEQRMHSEGG